MAESTEQLPSSLTNLEKPFWFEQEGKLGSKEAQVEKTLPLSLVIMNKSGHGLYSVRAERYESLTDQHWTMLFYVKGF